MTEAVLTPEESDLAYTNNIRKNMIRNLVGDEGVATKDVKELNVVIKALDGIDKSALGKLKLKTENEVADKNIAASTNIAHILSTRTTQELLPQTKDVQGVILEIDDSLIEGVTIVEGELEINTTPQNYDTFMNKFSNDTK